MKEIRRNVKDIAVFLLLRGPKGAKPRLWGRQTCRVPRTRADCEEGREAASAALSGEFRR